MTDSRRGLTLTLRARERVLIGGNLIENGPKRSSIKIFDDGVFVLRLSDALHPESITTPVTRAYHSAQLILAYEIEEQEGRADLVSRLNELTRVFRTMPQSEILAKACTAAEEGRYHSVLTALKGMIPIEAQMLSSFGTKSEPEPSADDGDTSDEEVRCTVSGRR